MFHFSPREFTVGLWVFVYWFLFFVYGFLHQGIKDSIKETWNNFFFLRYTQKPLPVGVNTYRKGYLRIIIKATSGGRRGIHILKHPYNLGLALLLSGQPTSGDKYFSRHEFGPFMPGRALKSPEIEVFANDSANGTVIFGFPILELV